MSQSAPRVRARDPSQLHRLLGYTRPYRIALIGATLATISSSVLWLIFPQLMGRLVDVALRPGAHLADLDRLVILPLALLLVRFGLNFAQIILLSRVGERVVTDLRRQLYAHLLSLSPGFFESRKTGELTSRLSNDVSSVQASVSNALTQLLTVIVTLVAGVIWLFVTNWQLAGLMLSIVPMIVIAAALTGRTLRRLSRDVRDRVADANADAQEATSNIRVVQSFTAEHLELERYTARVLESQRVALRRADVRALFEPGVAFGMFAAITVVLWYGARLILKGELTAGELTSFMIYTLMIANTINSFAALYGQYQDALGASSRIFELLDERSDLPDSTNPRSLASPEGRVNFDHVSFRYPDRGQDDALSDVTLEARPGEVIAVVGPSGAGKTTLVGLIPRFYDVSAGHVRVDGVDIRDLEKHALRGDIGIVPQETQLFSSSILENIRYGRPDASDAEVIDAARSANAHEFISAFPEGYATRVGERGVKLSGGQRQRVAIARAILKNPRILILDEATSALDSESETLVQNALEQLMQNRTTFVIAHRLSTVRNADRILCLENGRITETGTHDQLIARGGAYRELYELQFRRQARTELDLAP